MNYKTLSHLILLTAISLGIYFYIISNKADINFDYDIIIVGSGLAGLTAAIEANFISNSKLKILLLEKEEKYGGNSMKASSGINILSSPIQARDHISDSFDLFYADTIKSGKQHSIPELVSTLVTDSHNIYDFYTNLQIDLSKVGMLGGHSVPRTHRPATTPVGYTLTSSLYKIITTQYTDSIHIATNTTVLELLYDRSNNIVNGVSYKNETTGTKGVLYSKTIILATGGYAHDFINDGDNDSDSLLKQYVPHLMNFPTTNGPQAKGHGVKMARKIGAGLIDMDQVQVHPTGFVDLKDRFNKKKILAPEIIRGVGALLLNQNSERFCNELGPRDYVSQQIIKHCNKQTANVNIDQYEAIMILNQRAVDVYGPNMQFYLKQGLVQRYPNAKAVAEKFELDFGKMKHTLEMYNKNVNGTKDEFGKVYFPQQISVDEELYVAVVTPSIHYTMGGIKMTKDGEIQKESGEVIKALFGAGEVTGGVHGGNRLGGNSLLECAVFGRRAARSAVEYVHKRK